MRARGGSALRLPLRLLAALVLSACAGTPPPGWQLDAKSALDRALEAHLAGNTRSAAQELERARREVARSGRVDLLARVELSFCAARVASLDFEPCAAFERLRADAPAAERAYADYLGAAIDAKDVALLPEAQRTVAAGGAPRLERIEDPLARLVAAGVLLRSGRADPATAAAAAEAASARGWRRPLLAWLKVQLAAAEKAGADDEAERLRRRIGIVAGDESPRALPAPVTTPAGR